MINCQENNEDNASKRSPDRSRLVESASKEPQTLLASSGFLLARLGMESRRRFVRMMGEHKLTTHHFGLLLALEEHGSLPQQHLSRIMGVDPRNAVPIIDELERRKLIERQPNSQDRRRYDVRVTPTGRRIMKHLHRAGTKLEEEMLKPLNHAERTSLHRLLLKVFAELDEAP
jgi:MarR family transcriptional regulator, lower aerobic nicotinate degradation pathway regulator